MLFSRLREIESHTGEDYKTELQELVQARENGKLEYELVQESGPDHDKTFSISLRYMGDVVGQGTGKTKKEAEQKAAQKALALLREKAVSSESAPRSLVKLASVVTSDSSTPNLSTIIAFTLDAISDITLIS